MIHVDFVEPNFRYTYHTADHGQVPCRPAETALAYASSESQLRSLLERRRRRVLYIEKYEFLEWKRRALDATKRAIANPDAPFDSSIWCELKRYLFDMFDGRCAYCQAAVGITCPGDVEHYRPKRMVEGEPQHAGYYWLAYEITNLLPSCEECNRYRGKRCRFPIEGKRCFQPTSHEDLEEEHPLLLNPCKDVDIRSHLEFLPGQDRLMAGMVRGISRRGEMSRVIYNLSREPLNDARAAAQRTAEDNVRLAFARGDDEFVAAMDNYFRGRVEFSESIKAHLGYWWEAVRERLGI